MNRTNESEESCSKYGTDSSSPSTTKTTTPIIVNGKSKFNSLALNASFPGLSIKNDNSSNKLSKNHHGSIDSIWDFESNQEELWEDIGVVEFLENKLGGIDESTEEERVEALRDVLHDTDIIEGDGDLSDFLFHVARTKHGKIYIRVIRTLLLNRGNF